MTYEYNDYNNALLVYELTHGNLRYEKVTDTWYKWDGLWNKVDPIHDILYAADYRIVNLQQIDREKWSKEADWANKSHNNFHIKNTQEIMERLDEFKFPDSHESSHVFYTNTLAVNLQTGAIFRPQREEGLLIRSAIELDPDAKCPTWDNFITQIFDNKDLVTYFDRICGYTLTGCIDERCFFYMYGSGFNGKSTILHILEGIMGEYGSHAAFSTFESRRSDAPSNDLAALHKKRLVTASEPSSNSRWNDQLIKTITGKDPITARYLHKEFFTFQPQFKVWIAANHQIQTPDNGEAFWDRPRVIPLEQTFRGNPDLTLWDRLDSELPGILNRFIRGAIQWYDSGLKVPALVAAATQQYKENETGNIPGGLSIFLEEQTVSDSTIETTPTELYKSYKDWARSINMSEVESLSLNKFSRQMNTLKLYKLERRTDKRYYNLRITERMFHQ